MITGQISFQIDALNMKKGKQSTDIGIRVLL